MVNGLVEFSRIEAGRIEAIYEPTDLAQYTAELASVFRSVTERAGLRLTVDCQPLREPVYVGREMWEKIVLNLVGNALKFTFHGEIRETLNEESGRVVLAVADTGCGIPASELPKVQRFFLVRGVHSCTHEGTGIALALVQELARLHGGDARVESEEGRGSTFIVEIPTGDARISHRNAFTDAARSRRSPARMPLLRRRCGGFRCRRGRLPDQTFQRPGAIGAGRIAFASRKAAPGNRGARAGGQ